MLKKISLALVLIIIIFLFTPIPFRYGIIFCETPPGKPARYCPNEGDIGWNSPLIIRLVISLAKSRVNITRTEQNVDNVKKNEDSCNQNDDCKYIWFTGGCHTPEYVAKIQKEAESVGRRNGEAPSRENVFCTCESNVCVTH